jgi:hypothetical protein
MALTPEDAFTAAGDAFGITSESGDSMAVKDKTQANITWGNLVDLSDESYGLNTIKLYPAGSATASYTATVSAGNNTPAAYVIEDVEPGAYTMEVSKDKHATRTYSVTVGTADVTLDAKICPKGDISQDGKVNAKDYKLILQHVNKSKFLTDYALECAKINNDANVNAKDMKLMLQHINKSKPLF